MEIDSKFGVFSNVPSSSLPCDLSCGPCPYASPSRPPSAGRPATFGTTLTVLNFVPFSADHYFPCVCRDTVNMGIRAVFSISLFVLKSLDGRIVILPIKQKADGGCPHRPNRDTWLRSYVSGSRSCDQINFHRGVWSLTHLFVKHFPFYCLQ